MYILYIGKAMYNFLKKNTYPVVTLDDEMMEDLSFLLSSRKTICLENISSLKESHQRYLASFLSKYQIPSLVLLSSFDRIIPNLFHLMDVVQKDLPELNFSKTELYPFLENIDQVESLDQKYRIASEQHPFYWYYEYRYGKNLKHMIPWLGGNHARR